MLNERSQIENLQDRKTIGTEEIGAVTNWGDGKQLRKIPKSSYILG